MAKKQRITRGAISIILGILMLVAFIILGNKDWQEAETKDSQKFSEVFVNVPQDNVFDIKTLKETNEIIASKTGIIFLGFPSNKWCQAYAKYIDEVAKEMQIEEIIYSDIYYDIENNSTEYQKTVSLLKDFLPFDDKNQKRIFVPQLVIVKDGVVLSHNNETATIFTSDENSSEAYWSTERVNEFKNTLRTMFLNFKPQSVCTDCNNLDLN